MKKGETAFDALKRIEELERENKKLKDKVKMLRFDLLKKEERAGVKAVFDMQHPGENILPFDSEWEHFKCEYMDYRDTLPLDYEDILI